MATAAVAALVVLSACGNGAGGTEPSAQVAPQTKASVAADLGNVPIPPLARPIGPLYKAADGTATRNYAVRNMTVEAVMTFYRKQLADRPVVKAVADALGSWKVLRGEWRLDAGVIRVTVTPAPALGGQVADSGHDEVQLSLQLLPR